MMAYQAKLSTMSFALVPSSLHIPICINEETVFMMVNICCCSVARICVGIAGCWPASL
jgi:hypothetical protein